MESGVSLTNLEDHPTEEYCTQLWLPVLILLSDGWTGCGTACSLTKSLLYTSSVLRVFASSFMNASSCPSSFFLARCTPTTDCIICDLNVHAVLKLSSQLRTLRWSWRSHGVQKCYAVNDRVRNWTERFKETKLHKAVWHETTWKINTTCFHVNDNSGDNAMHIFSRTVCLGEEFTCPGLNVCQSLPCKQLSECRRGMHWPLQRQGNVANEDTVLYVAQTTPSDCTSPGYTYTM